jgi:hypothetical protein
MATATQQRTDNNLAAGKGDGYNVKSLCSTVELAASASGVTIDFGRIPSNARILPSSRLYVDDCATSGSPTLDLGLGAVDGNLANADDPDAIGNGHALSSAANDLVVFNSDIANHGLPAWDLVASETSDPGGVLKVYGSVKDAATTATGTITLDLYYTLD